MTLLEAIGPLPGKTVISICGGGGKTSTLFHLGQLLRNKPVLITTTTKIMRPAESPEYLVVDNPEELKPEAGKAPLVYGVFSSDYPGKLTGCGFPFIESMREKFSVILVEADGSAGRPVKAPEIHEPAVSPLTDIYISLIGLDCLNRRGDDSTVHRPGKFAMIREKTEGEPIVTEDLIKLAVHREGLFKNSPEGCRKIILLNKADLLPVQEGKRIAEDIAEALPFPAVVILNSYKKNPTVLFTTARE